jgi:DNA invertase Pin-like site-specific DNA recombinase
MQPVAVYVRISEDPTGRGLGVERQERECREVADRLGLTVAEVFTDNDLSATSGKKRPAFERLLASPYDVWIVWHLDRLVRVSRDLERVLDRGVTVHAATSAGALDLSTPTGRMNARIGTVVATFEGEHKAERQRAANAQRARDGLPQWSARPYGFERDGTHRPDEAARLRQAYADIIDGKSLSAVGRDMGMNPSSARYVLLHPRNIARRVYKGQDVGPATWQPVVQVETFNAAVAVLTNPARNAGGRTPKYLLAGIAYTPAGDRVRTTKNRARNRPAYRGPGAQRAVAVVDQYVSAWTVSLLAMPGAREVLTEREGPDMDALRAERADLMARRSEWLTSGMRPADVALALAPLDARLSEVEAALVDGTRADVFGDLWDEIHDPDTAPTERFDALPLHRRRAIIEALWARITLRPGSAQPPVEMVPTGLAERIISDTDRQMSDRLTDARDRLATVRDMRFRVNP